MGFIRKSIPNTITSMNLLSGAIGVILCLGGDVRAAFLLMLASAVFDFFDGLAARVLEAYSDIGKELDSLADMISFGLLPSLMLHRTMVQGGVHGAAAFIPLILAIFSALRLAKFNIDPRQHDSFIGLATPAAAMICGSLCHFVAGHPDGSVATICASYWALPVLGITLSALLVSEIPMFSMKFGKGKGTDKATVRIRIAFLVMIPVIVLAVAAAGLEWSLAVCFTFIGYILLNILSALLPKSN